MSEIDIDREQDRGLATFFSPRISLPTVKEIVLILGLTVLCVSGLELAAWTVLKLKSSFSSPFYPLTFSDRDIQLLYGTTEVESYREMLRETWAELNPGSRYEPFVEWLPPQHYHGTYVKVSPPGYRHVAEQEAFLSGTKTSIFVFGGSTTFGYGVKNSETIPSYLQQLLQAKGKDVAVYNFGAASFFSTLERIRYEQLLTSGFVPQVAIFIDGLNDFYYFEVPDRSLWSDYIAATTMEGTQGLLAAFMHHSQLMKLFQRGAAKLTAHKRYADDQQIARAAYRLATNRKLLAAISQSLGIRTVFVQQPVPTFHFDEKRRAVAIPQANVPRQENCRAGYELMLSQRAKGETFNQDVLWLQDLTIEGNEYVDAIHYSPAFHHAIAEQIADYLVTPTR